MHLFYHKLPIKPAALTCFENLSGSSQSLAVFEAAKHYAKPLLVIAPDLLALDTLERELKFFASTNNVDNERLPILSFPDWETLPYDHFSPHQDIISQRLFFLHKIQNLKTGIMLVAANSLMQRLPPRAYIEKNVFILHKKEHLNITELRARFERLGYICVAKVMEHGEFAVRGSIIDLFPTGSNLPFRIDLVDDEIDSIRTFDPDSQLSKEILENIQLMPAKEYPLTEEAITAFRQNWRTQFIGDPTRCSVYQSVSLGESPQGVEYYLPLFFNETATFFDYLPEHTLLYSINTEKHIWQKLTQEINNRYEQLKHDQSHPLLPPANIYLNEQEILSHMHKFLLTKVFDQSNVKDNEYSTTICFKTEKILDISINHKLETPLSKLTEYIKNINGRILFVAESAGRRENLLELLKTININPNQFPNWESFLKAPDQYGITIAEIDRGMHILGDKNQPSLALITEAELFGQKVMQRRLRKAAITQDPEAIIRDLTELHIGAPVVHYEHGVGRYLGMQTLKIDAIETEFLVLEYEGNAKLYVPISSLNLISRYTGMDAEHAPLHQLGSKQWDKVKREAVEKIRDTAAELLEIYAKRAHSVGYAFSKPDNDYEKFAASFPFEETADQTRAINEVISDMTQPRPMDRLVCGDVGFGKTEVAMRAAFLAAHDGKQVAVLTPTTILSNQHFTNFKDRFTDWPINIELFSRFRSKKETIKIAEQLQSGKIDIIIGTHKLLQPNIHFKNLGLLIIDEEHRFGVRQKEHIKKFYPNIDILTLTATPIPRTLSMAFATIRDFSIIATPPAKRLSVKTFAHERDRYLIKEAITREIMRGGQVYFLHNDIATMKKVADEVLKLIPTARIDIAHGQMHEQALESIMRDFYHLRTNVLVCTTIIESGIDIPTANTIIIDRADKFGLAQLHQLRGRVGRSHHQAYAYLLVPPEDLLTEDAKKRLHAIVSMEDLGAGFTLATHDLEIRGAGELLGEGQSGQIQNIGFDLYTDLLNRAIATLKTSKKLDLDAQISKSIEINLRIPALIPDDYVSDVGIRLTLYKRIASAKTSDALSNLQIEIIDRFGSLPKQVKNLFKVNELRLKAEVLDVKKITLGNNKGSIEFAENPNIDPKKVIKLIQENPKLYRLKGPSILEFFAIKTPEQITDLLHHIERS